MNNTASSRCLSHCCEVITIVFYHTLAHGAQGKMMGVRPLLAEFCVMYGLGESDLTEAYE